MSDAGHQLGIPAGQVMRGLLGHMPGDRHKMVALAINWVTCEPSQDTGPGLGARVRRPSPEGTHPGCI